MFRKKSAFDFIVFGLLLIPNLSLDFELSSMPKQFPRLFDQDESIDKQKYMENDMKSFLLIPVVTLVKNVKFKR
jgi:hypothetical protein